MIKEVWEFEDISDVNISEIRKLDKKQNLIITLNCNKLEILFDLKDDGYAKDFISNVSLLYPKTRLYGERL